MEDRKTQPRWTPGVRRDNDPRAIVEEKLRHAMFDGGWAAWKKDPSIVSPRYKLRLDPAPFRSFTGPALTSMVGGILTEAAGIEDARCYLNSDALILTIPKAEIEKLYDAIDEHGPGSQRRNVVTLNFGRSA